MSIVGHHRARTATLALLALVVASVSLLLSTVPDASAAGRARTEFREAKGWLMFAPTMATTPSGDLILAYVRYGRRKNVFDQDVTTGQIIVRVKRKRSDHFGPPTFRGPPRTFIYKMEVTPTGEILLVWRARNGVGFSSTGRVGKPWSKPARIPGFVPDSINPSSLSVGTDGTAAIFAGHNTHSPGYSSDLYVAISPPGGAFGGFRKVSDSAYGERFYIALSAGTNGRATVAWTARCPLGASLNEIPESQFVDIAPGEVSPPTDIPGVRCPLENFQLQQDKYGVQYLKTGGFDGHLGVKVTSRMPGAPFSPPETLDSWNNDKSHLVGGSLLSVSPSGYATVAWQIMSQRSARRVGYLHSKTKNGAPFSDPRQTRPNRGPAYTSLGDIFTRPGGTVDGIWLDVRRQWKIGFGLGTQRHPFAGPSFRPSFGLPEGCVPDLGVLDRRSTGYFGWWSLQNAERDCEIHGVHWVGRAK